MATDQLGCVHIAWAGIAENAAIYRKVCSTPDGGEVFSGGVNVSSGVNGPRRVAIGANSAGNLVVGWDSSNVMYFNTFNGLGWTGAQPAENANGSQLWADVHGAPNGNIALVWEESVGGQFDPAFRFFPFTVGPTPTPPATATPLASPTPSASPTTAPTATPTTPPVPIGTLEINGGATFTNSPNVSARITNSGGAATSYTLTGAGQSSGAFTPDGANSMAVNVTIATQQCVVQSLTGLLSGPSGNSNLFSDSIVYDGAVSANARAVNPNLDSNNRPVMTRPLVNAMGYGDNGYTRDRSRVLVVIDPQADECSGLQDFIVGGTGETAIPSATDSRWRALPSGYSLITALPAQQPEGQLYAFKLFLRDRAGNTASKDLSIIYDATPPSAELTSGTTVTTTATSSFSDVVSLDLASLRVTDNAYPNGYWGTWIMVNTDPTGDPGSTDWNQYGVVTRGQLGATLTWNLLFGNRTDPQPNQTYYVHLRFIDGAGNVTGTVINSTGVAPTSFSSALRAYLPIAQR